MTLNKLLFLLVSCFIFSSTYAQKKEENYYLFPINPGKQSFLAGTMGELRPGHFHGGIDVKTGGRIGVPILAAAEGYVSRIKISHGGYGHALYIQHPNGETTVYAHLDRFANKIQKHVVEQQYKNESYTIQLYPSKTDFIVKKGDTIAFSGNTGGSSGPHLHFEIRNKNQEPIDPLSFGFKEVKDNIPPQFYSISARPLTIDSRVKNFYYPFIFPVDAEYNKFKTIDTIRAFGEIGLSINANDLLDGVPNKNGIPIVKMFVRDSLYYSSNLTKFSFGTQNRIKVLIDYDMYANGRGTFRKCYLDDGNDLSFNNSPNKDGGVIHVQVGDTIPVKIHAEDLYGNSSTLETVIVGTKPQQALSFISDKKEEITIEHSIYKNVLKVFTSRPSLDAEIIVYQNFKRIRLEPDYITEKANFFLWDLNNGLPDSVTFLDKSHRFNFVSRVDNGHYTNVFENNFNVKFPKSSLFDTLYLEMTAKDNYYSFGQSTTPLKGRVKVEISSIPDTISDTLKYSLYAAGSRYSFISNIDKTQELSFRTKYFGSYTFLQDSIPPTIRLLSRSWNKIQFEIKDELSGVNSYRATLNGEWLLMQYDAKKNKISSLQIDESKALKGNFVLEVIDNQGNKTLFEQTL